MVRRGRGRKPLPTAVKFARGTAQHNPQDINKREPKQPPGPLSPPSDLDEYARQEWQRLRDALSQMGLESPAYASALRALVEAYSDYRKTRERVLQIGFAITRKDDNGKVTVSRNPFAAEMRAARDAYIRLLVEFGLTPSAKSRVSAESNADGDDAYWFGGVG